MWITGSNDHAGQKKEEETAIMTVYSSFFEKSTTEREKALSKSNSERLQVQSHIPGFNQVSLAEEL